MGLGKNLMNALYDRRMTQTALAEQLGVTQAAVSAWVAEKKRPTIEMCVKIADVLGCTLDELIRKKEV